MGTYKLKQSYYSHELKGLGFSTAIILILGIVNNYAISIKQLLFSNNGWLIGVFVIATIVIALVVKMYQRVTLLKK